MPSYNGLPDGRVSIVIMRCQLTSCPEGGGRGGSEGGSHGSDDNADSSNNCNKGSSLRWLQKSGQEEGVNRKKDKQNAAVKREACKERTQNGKIQKKEKLK